MVKYSSAILLLTLLVATSPAQEKFYDRNEIPGNYTLGLYADQNGRSNEIVLPEGQDEFQAWIGITGDSTRVFSAMVCRIELPRGLAIDGPVLWRPIPGLVQWGTATAEGLQVEFNKECQRYNGVTPVMLGRARFKVDRKDFESGTIALVGHRQWGISVELCQPDKAWPKPYCEAINLEVTRKKSFWQKLRSIFG